MKRENDFKCECGCETPMHKDSGVVYLYEGGEKIMTVPCFKKHKAEFQERRFCSGH